ADVTDLFNVLTGVARKDSYRRLLVAPVSLRSGIHRLIRDEVERHEAHGDGRIVMKVNSIVDPGIIEALYVASQAGVPVELIVRGMCSLVPGKPGASETIAVRSVVGRFLEHSRILCFGRGDRERFLIGSADMMERNLDRRVEALVPVEDPALQDRLRTILEVMLRDDRRAWTLDADGAWRRVEAEAEPSSGLDTFQVLAGLVAASRADHLSGS
ncbi:MAG: RNA degradosome polyphosphate kinase, partial [Candidatus Limnocylindrales bacterium]